MIWLIISLIVTIAIIVHIWYEDLWVGIGTCIMESFLAILVSCAVTLLVVLFSSVVVSSCDNVIEYNKASDTKIIALKDNQDISGSFYIMGGYVDEDLYYYYATETEFGYKTEKVKAENVYIKYTDGETHIERYVGEFANDGNNLWGFPMCDDRYIIYVPDGTVTNEFIVDLE